MLVNCALKASKVREPKALETDDSFWHQQWHQLVCGAKECAKVVPQAGKLEAGKLNLTDKLECGIL